MTASPSRRVGLNDRARAGEWDAMTEPAGTIDLEHLGLDAGAHLLLDRGLRGLAPGEAVAVVGTDPALAAHLPAWCRHRGHGLAAGDGGWTIVRGQAQTQRWRDAVRAGDPGPEGIVARPAADWGLAARGALVEAGRSAAALRLRRT